MTTGRDKNQYSFSINGVEHIYEAYTRGEARAMCKKELKIKNGPLPCLGVWNREYRNRRNLDIVGL